MHRAVLRKFAQRLALRFRVTLVDLPGHGGSGLIEDLSLSGISGALLEQAPERAHWVGWSLGAAVALHAAGTAESRVCSLIMMAGSPKFVGNDGWPGMDESILLQFARELREDYPQTLQRFLGLQVWGLEDARELLKDLRSCLAEHEPPREEALEAGLGILRSADLRHTLGELRMPALAILGRRDRLVPVAAGEAMRQLNDNMEVRVLEHATHIPFWTHPDETLTEVQCFLNRHDG